MDRQVSEIEKIAIRLASVIDKKPEEITLRLIGEICWALGVEPEIELIKIENDES